MESIGGFDISPGTRFRRHQHGTAHVCVVLGGGFAEREASGWRDVPAGTIRVSGAARHDCDFGPQGARCLLLEIDDDAIATPDGPRFLPADGWMARLAGRLHSAIAAGEPAAGSNP